MTSGRSDLVDVAGELRVDREKSILLYDGATEICLPKSLIEIEPTGPGNVVTVTMPEWLAHREGLI